MVIRWLVVSLAIVLIAIMLQVNPLLALIVSGIVIAFFWAITDAIGIVMYPLFKSRNKTEKRIEPKIEEPVTEEPVTEEPVTEEPVTEEPVTEELKKFYGDTKNNLPNIIKTIGYQTEFMNQLESIRDGSMLAAAEQIVKDIRSGARALEIEKAMRQNNTFLAQQCAELQLHEHEFRELCNKHPTLEQARREFEMIKSLVE